MPNPSDYSDVPTTTFSIIDTVVEGNSWAAREAQKGEQLPFYFFDVRRVAGVLIDGLRGDMNTVSNVEESGTSPSYYGIVHMDTYDVKNQGDLQVRIYSSYYDYHDYFFVDIFMHVFIIL